MATKKEERRFFKVELKGLERKIDAIILARRATIHDPTIKEAEDCLYMKYIAYRELLKRGYE